MVPRQLPQQSDSASSSSQHSHTRHDLLALTLTIACLFVCCQRHDPQELLDRAKQAYRHGDMVAAATEAEAGYNEFRHNPEWAWQFTILRARIRFWRGQYEDVLKLTSSEPATIPSGDLAVQRGRIDSVAYANLHQTSEAEASLTRAEQICLVTPSPSCQDLVTGRGVVQMTLSHYPQGQRFFEQALASARAASDSYLEANALLNLSWSSLEQVHLEQAIEWANEARQIAIAQDYSDLAQNALGNMGWGYYRDGENEKALGMFTDARKQAEKLGDTSDQISWLTNAGYVYMAMRDFSVAEKSFKDSLQMARGAKSRDDIINSLIALAFFDEQTGKLEDAKRNAEESLAMSVADGNKRDQVYPKLVLGRVAAQRHETAAAEAAFAEVIQSPDAPIFLKWQAGHSLANLYENENQPEAAEREYRNALSIFEAARNDLTKLDSRLPFLTNATSIYEDYIHFLVTQGKSAEALQVADYGRARTLREGLGLLPPGGSFNPDPVNATQIAHHLGGTILFYWLGEKKSYLWAVTPQKISLFNLPPASEIKTGVQHYRKALLGEDYASGDSQIADQGNDQSDGAALYRMLVAPAQDLLPRAPQIDSVLKNAARKTVPAKPAPVFVIADGSLNDLNFETLLAPDPKPHYWIEDVTISNSSSLRLLQAAHHIKSSNRSLLLFGDAVATVPDFPPLPKAAAEMQHIENHFPATEQKVLARERATPAAYLDSKPEQFSYIHFVAHGTASRQSPLDSAIVLSRSSGEGDSFKLYARDIMLHRIHADLVTVSACHGAGVRAYSGEGLVGLSWAFLHAGAHNVIGALWEVSDDSTPELMDELYRNLKKGETPEAALRGAKLTLLHSQGAFHKPYYWAPFQLYTGS
jgi:CHAT domain-containing protein/tetratricopeptide (TPR) repeat protein